jgi:hypothetical protein
MEIAGDCFNWASWGRSQTLKSPLGENIQDQTVGERVLVQTSKAPLPAVTAWMTEPASAQELFKGRHFDQEIIILCVRWYLTFKLSSRDLVR